MTRPGPRRRASWGPLRLSALLAFGVAVLLPGARASGPWRAATPATAMSSVPSTVADDGDEDEARQIAVERARNALRAERRALADALGAQRAALDSVRRTLDWLATQLVGDGPDSEGLDGELAGLRTRRRDAQAELDALARKVAAYDAACAGLLVSDVSEQDLLDAVSAGLDLGDRIEPLGRRADGLVRDVVAANVRVERRRVSRGALDGPAEEGLAPPPPPAWLADEPVVELITSEGSLVLALRPDVAPRHVANFQRLVREGFYDGLTFHRVVTGFVAQGGDPLGTGMGGPGWQIRNEFNDLPHLRGSLSMARMGQWDTAGSQFFLCLDDWSAELDGKYTVFGSLLAGHDVLDAIAGLGTPVGTPTRPITIHRAVLRERLPTDTDDAQG